MAHTRTPHPFPTHFWIGLALVAVFWPLNWLLPGLRTQFLFFPLWLGYALAVDGLVYRRKGTSLATRSPRAYAALFVISAPAWWLFEALNLRTHNWVYVGREFFTFGQYVALATISFSTVMPAVFGTAELAGSFGWLRRIGRGPIIRPTRAVTLAGFAAGWLMLALMLAWPRYCFPFMWLSLVFIFEPLNVWFGNRALVDSTASGDWRPILALWVGVLITAFFWEMWNYFSYPQWVYHVPFVDFLHVFEMPILGYGGYLPFSIELFALFHMVVGLLRLPLRDYVHLVD